jgi:hypothetical protein
MRNSTMNATSAQEFQNRVCPGNPKGVAGFKA